MLLAVVVPVVVMVVGLVVPVVVAVEVVVGSVVEVVVEDGGAGVVVDDVPIGVAVPVDEPAELLTLDGLGAFVRGLPAACFACAQCVVGEGATWEPAVVGEGVVGRARAPWSILRVEWE